MCFFVPYKRRETQQNLKNGTYGYITTAICDHDANEKCRGRVPRCFKHLYSAFFPAPGGSQTYLPKLTISSSETPPSSSSNHIFQVRIMRCLEPGETTEVLGETTDVWQLSKHTKRRHMF